MAKNEIFESAENSSAKDSLAEGVHFAQSVCGDHSAMAEVNLIQASLGHIMKVSPRSEAAGLDGVNKGSCVPLGVG